MISPIPSFNSYSPVAKVQPMQYALNNTSEVSSVYDTDTTKNSSGINGVRPVKYPDATLFEASPVDKKAEKQELTKQFNEIADSISKGFTGYTNTSRGTNYELIGKNIDIYA